MAAAALTAYHTAADRRRLPARHVIAREPPVGDGWLYEIKHDGHRLAVIADGEGGVRLLSRNGYERSRHFGAVFADLARLGRQILLDGEITAPDERGVTHHDDLAAAMQRRLPTSPSTSCTSTAAT
jgi:bifunctional non-homologous end joining protein LigD